MQTAIAIFRFGFRESIEGNMAALGATLHLSIFAPIPQNDKKEDYGYYGRKYLIW